MILCWKTTITQLITEYAPLSILYSHLTFNIQEQEFQIPHYYMAGKHILINRLQFITTE
jgi:hypothetical protein